MHIIIIGVLIALIGFFGLKASKFGALSFAEIPVFGVLCLGLAGYLVFLIYDLAK